jgi:hypothetical protein
MFDVILQREVEEAFWRTWNRAEPTQQGAILHALRAIHKRLRMIR